MKKRISAFILLLCFTAGIFFSSTITVAAAETGTGDTILVFTSDPHHTSTKEDGAAKSLKTLLQYVTTIT